MRRQGSASSPGSTRADEAGGGRASWSALRRDVSSSEASRAQRTRGPLAAGRTTARRLGYWCFYCRRGRG